MFNSAGTSAPANLANRFSENVVNLVIVSECIAPIHKIADVKIRFSIPDLEKYGVRIVSAVRFSRNDRVFREAAAEKIA